jgi:hypothetical protein
VIFIGYEEASIGWLVCDLNGKVMFSRDVIFNEDLSCHFAIPQLLPSKDIVCSDTVHNIPTHPAHES